MLLSRVLSLVFYSEEHGKRSVCRFATVAPIKTPLGNSAWTGPLVHLKADVRVRKRAHGHVTIRTIPSERRNVRPAALRIDPSLGVRATTPCPFFQPDFGGSLSERTLAGQCAEWGGTNFFVKAGCSAFLLLHCCWGASIKRTASKELFEKGATLEPLSGQLPCCTDSVCVCSEKSFVRNEREGEVWGVEGCLM